MDSVNRRNEDLDLKEGELVLERRRRSGRVEGNWSWCKRSWLHNWRLKRRDIWGASRDGLGTEGEKWRKKRGKDKHTQPPTSSEGINEFIKDTYDEYPDEPTSNVGCSSESPVLARRLGIWEPGDSGEEHLLSEFILRRGRETYWKRMNTALKSKKDCKGMWYKTIKGQR
jgi:hypothetical protein